MSGWWLLPYAALILALAVGVPWLLHVREEKRQGLR